MPSTASIRLVETTRRRPSPLFSADAVRLYEAEAAADGYVINASRLWAWRPDVLQAFIELRAMLRETSALTPRDFDILVYAAAAELEDSYCALAFGRRVADQAGPMAAAALLRDESHANVTARDRTLATWARRVARDPSGTRPEDVAALRAIGLDGLALR